MHTTVLIIGGGISGLSAALFLLQQGITPLVIERHTGTSIHPRARGFDVRTMELYRELGLSEAIREAGKSLAPAWGIHTAPSLAVYLKNKKPKKAIKSPLELKGLEDLMAQTPETGARCTQDLSEPVLLEAARARGAAIWFNTELMSFTQDQEGVTAITRNRETGLEQTIRAEYMMAADGAKGGIRESLGAQTTGKGPLGNLLNIYFEAPLAGVVGGKEFSLLRIDEPKCKGLLTSINNSDRWVFHLHYDPAKGERPENFTRERLIAILEQVIGLSGIPIRILSVLPWQPTVRVVTEMQFGRIFLAGDAAHTMTPYGGKGANSGVQDAHNLAWKLTYTLKGKASPALLETYSPERQPIGLRYAIQSGEMANGYGLIRKVIVKFFWAFGSVMLLSFLRLQKFFPGFSMFQLGELLGLPEYRYRSAAILPESLASPSTILLPNPDNRRTGYTRSGPLKAQPGTRFPHLWVSYNEQKISILDLLGKDFILFIGADSPETTENPQATESTPWRRAASETAAYLQISLPVYSIGKHGEITRTGHSSNKPITSILGISAQGAVLVRPDGFVAWRSAHLPASPVETLKKVLIKILGLDVWRPISEISL